VHGKKLLESLRSAIICQAHWVLSGQGLGYVAFSQPEFGFNFGLRAGWGGTVYLVNLTDATLFRGVVYVLEILRVPPPSGVGRAEGLIMFPRENFHWNLDSLEWNFQSFWSRAVRRSWSTGPGAPAYFAGAGAAVGKLRQWTPADKIRKHYFIFQWTFGNGKIKLNDLKLL
jgi:hypothetical protein